MIKSQMMPILNLNIHNCQMFYRAYMLCLIIMITTCNNFCNKLFRAKIHDVS